MPDSAPEVVRRRIFRHRISTRLWHWLNALAFFMMVMSGLMIFNAHPRLYWGKYGANFDYAWLEISSHGGRGYLRIGPRMFDTTGVLGLSGNQATQHFRPTAFPGWATIPSSYNLADARMWHLFFAWILAVGLAAYLVVSVWNRHLQKEVAPTRDELAPSHVWQNIKDHARLRFPTGEAATRYNILQKLSYGSVLLLLLPLMILTGLCMSPGADPWLPWLVDVFGGRQSARSIHFITMWLLLAFFVVHIAMVFLAGPINEIGSMITGRYSIKPEPKARLQAAALPPRPTAGEDDDGEPS
ncbi:MAG TPA: cytochrome b/b6 domain-containing protein [Sphingomicrobium sp.]|nr:cytochrome b/b6 domain-containing protein [Sphingomicrobium sp.]